MMKAIKFKGGNRVEVIEVARPKPYGDWILVRMTASGICGTDLELLLPSESAITITAGHEVAGRVEEAPRSAVFRPGDRVMVNCHVTCGHCDHCKNGDLVFCPELKAIGFDYDGGNAEFLLVPEASLRHLPGDISDEEGVLIGDALGTPYHAVKKAEIRPGQFVGVFGVGPLGQMAVLSAATFGARVVAVDLNESRLEAAKKFGAEFTLNPRAGETGKSLSLITGGRGLESAIECSGVEKAIILAMDLLRPRGRLVQVGVCPRVTLDTFQHLINKELEIFGSRNSSMGELGELTDFVRSHPLVREVVTHRFGLDQAEEAFKTARAGVGLKIMFKQ